jgi:hypothetical protein
VQHNGFNFELIAVKSEHPSVPDCENSDTRGPNRNPEPSTGSIKDPKSIRRWLKRG